MNPDPRLIHSFLKIVEMPINAPADSWLVRHAVQSAIEAVLTLFWIRQRPARTYTEDALIGMKGIFVLFEHFNEEQRRY